MTIIDKGTSIVGNITVENDITVAGMVQGELTVTDTLIVKKSGVLEAQVKVKNAVVAGKIVGTLIASQQVKLESKAILIGDLWANSLIIEEGATFHGRSNMQIADQESEIQESHDGERAEAVEREKR